MSQLFSNSVKISYFNDKQRNLKNEKNRLCVLQFIVSATLFLFVSGFITKEFTLEQVRRKWLKADSRTFTQELSNRGNRELRNRGD